MKKKNIFKLLFVVAMILFVAPIAMYAQDSLANDTTSIGTDGNIGDIMVYFVNLPTLFLLLSLISGWLTKQTNLTGFALQIQYFVTALVLCIVGKLLELGMFVGLGWGSTVLDGLELGLMTNAIWQMDWVKQLWGILRGKTGK